MTRRAPRWAETATAPLRRREASLGWSWVRLGVWAVVVPAVYLWLLSATGRLGVALIFSVGVSVLLSPMLLLAVERITSPGEKDTPSGAPKLDNHG